MNFRSLVAFPSRILNKILDSIIERLINNPYCLAVVKDHLELKFLRSEFKAELKAIIEQEVNERLDSAFIDVDVENEVDKRLERLFEDVNVEDLVQSEAQAAVENCSVEREVELAVEDALKEVDVNEAVEETLSNVDPETLLREALADAMIRAADSVRVH